VFSQGAAVPGKPEHKSLPKTLQIFQAEPEKVTQGKAGLEVSFLGRQWRTVGSSHPLLSASQPAVP